MRRTIEKELLAWKESPHRLPLILRGARQVGKSYIIQNFGTKRFKQCVSINFEIRFDAARCFDTLDPAHIVREIELLTGSSIIPGHTLLFLDEIQSCPRAILSLRYFKEQIPKLHVIAAGSLLEFALHEESFSFPVGRVQFMYLKPLSFHEFLQALGQEKLLELLATVSLQKPPSSAIHDHLLGYVRQYLLVGGMPATVTMFKERHSFLDCQRRHGALLQTFQSDFGKYATKSEHKYLQLLFEKAPLLVGDHFRYAKVDPESRSRSLKIALQQLQWAGLIYPVHATAASGLPLQVHKRENKFKLLFLDVGLMQTAIGVDLNKWEGDISLLSKGAVTEQFVGQELLAYADCYSPSALYFWEREKVSSSAEIDYLFVQSGEIYPIEVKAGTTGHLRSLHQFMQEKKSRLGIQISSQPLCKKGNILSIPFYLIEELPRLIAQ